MSPEDVPAELVEKAAEVMYSRLYWVERITFAEATATVAGALAAVLPDVYEEMRQGMDESYGMGYKEGFETQERAEIQAQALREAADALGQKRALVYGSGLGVLVTPAADGGGMHDVETDDMPDLPEWLRARAARLRLQNEHAPDIHARDTGKAVQVSIHDTAHNITYEQAEVLRRQLGSVMLSRLADTTEDRKTADEWCQQLGVTIIDPDGWREDCAAWGTLLTEAEFHERAARSTSTSVALAEGSPCMSCGERRTIRAPGRCLQPHNHTTEEAAT